MRKGDVKLIRMESTTRGCKIKKCDTQGDVKPIRVKRYKVNASWIE